MAVLHEERVVMRTLIQHFRRDVLRRAADSRVAENMLIAAVRGKVGSALLNDMTCPFVDEQRRCTYKRRGVGLLTAECTMSIDVFGYDEKCLGQ